MDISQKVNQETKDRIRNLVVESQVLQSLLNERKGMLQAEMQSVIKENTKSPQLYILECNPDKDIWDLKLKPEALSIPAPPKIPARN